MSVQDGIASSTRTTRALVLLGHGSHLNPASSAPIYESAQRIRERGLFDEVIEGFWKEEPSLTDVLGLVESEQIFIVPLFLAEGYFTTRVVPRELGLGSNEASLEGQTIHYCTPVGAHSAMRRLILDRALDAIGPAATDSGAAALVIVGHGTPRSPTSGDSVHRLVNELRDTAEFATVTCGFLDQEPRVGNVLETLEEKHVVLVPFFVAEGWHTAETIPRELGLHGEVTARSGSVIYYTPPIGTLPEIAEVALEVARDAGAFDDGTTPPGRDRSRSSTALSLARRAFLEWVDEGGLEGREFLQLAVRSVGPDAYEVRHRDDRHLSISMLRPEARARGALSIARFDVAGHYRPLRTAESLVPGWVLNGLSPDELWEAVSLFYPAAALHWYQWHTGVLDVVTFTACAKRQTGAYESLRETSPEALDAPIESCCGSCSKTRVWEFDSLRILPNASGVAPSEAALVPCREPCTFFRTTLRQLIAPADRAS